MSVEDDIYRAVQSALCRGMTVKDFLKLARDAWCDELHDKERYDLEEFNRALAPKLGNGPA